MGMIEEFDPQTIEDERVHQVVMELMNLVETLLARLGEKDEVIQQLRDEINRLKGEQGKPKITANKQAPDLSSEKERRQSKPRNSHSKQNQIPIDREVALKIDREHLPDDAVFKGYENVVVQDLSIRSDNVQFRKEKYYSPGHKRTYLAPLPAGYHGQFGPKVRAWVLAMYYAGQMSEPKILEVLQTAGMQISAGQLSTMLIKDQDLFHQERAAVVKAGLESSPWQHLDSTGTRVNGVNQHCHVLCNPLYSFYYTTQGLDRRSYLRVLLGGADLTFRLNERAVVLLEQLKVGQKWRAKVAQVVPQEQDLDEEQLDALLDRHLPTLGPLVRKDIKDGLAIAAYQTQSSYPIVSLLRSRRCPPIQLVDPRVGAVLDP